MNTARRMVRPIAVAAAVSIAFFGSASSWAAPVCPPGNAMALEQCQMTCDNGPNYKGCMQFCAQKFSCPGS